jgi:hypothetical protein
MAITIDTPVSYRVFQRSGTTGSIYVTGSYTGSPTAIEGSFNGGSFSTFVASPSGGIYSGSLTGQAQGQGSLTVRFTNDTSSSAITNFIGIGDVFIIAGQSNAAGYSNGPNYSYSPTLKGGLFGNDYNWKQLADPTDDATNQVDSVSIDLSCNGSAWTVLSTYYMQSVGVPVAFVPCALTSTSGSSWQPGANHFDRATLYGSMAYRALQTGAKAVLYWQGEDDAIQGTSEATYNSYIDNLANSVQSDLGVKFMPCTIFTMDQAPYVANTTNVCNAIRTAWDDNSNVLRGPDFNDIKASELTGIHFGQPHSYMIGIRWWYALRDAFGYSDNAVQSNQYWLSASSIPCTFKKQVTSGNLIVVSIAQYDGTIMNGSSITDNHSNTYQLAGPVISYSGDSLLRLGIYYAYNVTGGSVTVTYNSPDTASISILAHEYTNILSTSDPFDRYAGAQAASGSVPSSGSTLVTNQANELVFGAFTPYSSDFMHTDPGPSFYLRNQYTDGNFTNILTTEDRVVGATGSYVANFTASYSAGWLAKAATFKIFTSTSAVVDASVTLEGMGNLSPIGQKISNIDLTLEYTTLSAIARTDTTLIKPNNTVDGDFLLALIYIESNSIVVTPPDGWNFICSTSSGDSSFRNILYYKRASGEPSDWTWTHDNTSPGFTGGFVKRFTGVVSSGNPEDCTREVNTGNNTTPVWNAITTLTDGAALIGVEGHFQTASRRTLSTLTERIDGDDVFLQADLKRIAGNSGSLGATDGTSGQWITQFLALKPEGESGSTNNLQNVIFIWPGTVATIPSGWTRVTSLDGLYPLGASSGSNPGSTGGSNIHVHTTGSHTHSGSAHTHTVPDSGSSSGASNRDAGTVRPRPLHTHVNNPSTTNSSATTGSQAPTSGSVNLEPDFYSVIYIQSNGTPNGLSASMVGLWNDDSSPPSGFALADGSGGKPDLRNKFLKGAGTGADSGSVSGSAGHTHTLDIHDHGGNYAHNHPTVTSSGSNQTMVGGPVSGAAVSVATQTHTHVLTINSQATDTITGSNCTFQSSNNEPPYIKQAFIQNTGGVSLPTGIIGLWTGLLSQIPLNWLLCDGTGGSTPDLRDKFIKSASALGEIGNTGGSLTHTHNATGHSHPIATHAHTISHASGGGSTETAGATAVPTTAHTHSWGNTGNSGAFSSTATTPTVSTEPSLPAYYTVAYIQYQGSGSGGVTTVSGSSSLSGNSGIDSTAFKNIQSLTTLINSGNFSVSSFLNILDSLSLGGTGNLTPTSLITGLLQSILSGQGNIQTNATLLISSIITLVGNGSLSTTAINNIIANSNLNGIGYLLAQIVENVEIDDIILLIQEIIDGNTTLSGQASTQFISFLNKFGSTNLDGNGFLISSSFLSMLSNTVLSGYVSLLGTILQTVNGIFIADGRGSLDIRSLLTILAQSILIGQNNIEINGALLLFVIAILSGNGYLNLNATNNISTNSTLSGNGYLNLNVINNIIANSNLSGIGYLLAQVLDVVQIDDIILLIQELIDGNVTLTGKVDNQFVSFLIELGLTNLSGAGLLASSGLLSVLGNTIISGQIGLITTVLQIINGTFIAEGKGSIDAQALLNILSQAILSGQGDIQANATLLFAVITTLTGNANLNISAVNNSVANLILLGNGDISSIPFSTIYSNVSLNGLVYIIADVFIQGLVTGNVTLVGQGNLIISALKQIIAQSTLTGEEVNSLQSLLVMGSLMTMFGSGSLDVTSIITLPAFTILNGIGSILPIGDIGRFIDAIVSLSGQGNLSVSAIQQVIAQSNLDGQTTLSLQSLLVIIGLISLFGAGSLDVSSLITIPAFTSLGGIASLFGVGDIGKFIDAIVSLSGRGDLSLSALEIVNAQLALYANGDINASPLLKVSAFTSLDGIAFLIATGIINVIANVVTGSAILAGQGDLILTALNIVNGEVLTTGQAIVSAQSLVNVLSNAILSGTGNTQAYATLLISAIGALYASGAIVSIGTIPAGILTITPLSRTYIIKGEDRIYVVDKEGRIFVINFEDRNFSITS